MIDITQQTVADTVAIELANAGVDRVFGLPGGEVLLLIEALRKVGISFELFRHEADAAFAAAVYGKLKGIPGVVLTTLGPGAANLLLPLSNSWLDREPIIAISATIPTSWPALHTHQRLDLTQLFQPVVKSVAGITSLSASREVRRAIQLSNEEPQGPVMLTLSAEDAATPTASVASLATSTTLAPVPGQDDAIAAAARQVSERLAAAERPVVVCGIGVQAANAELIRRWLDLWDLPVAVTPKVKGLVDETDKRFFGVVGGMSADAVMCEALEQSDLIIGLGFDPVEVDKRWHTELPILWVLESPQATGVLPVNNLVHAPHDLLLAALCDSRPPRQWEDSVVPFRERRNALGQGDGRSTSEGVIEPTALVRALESVMPANTIVTTDVGSHKYLFGQFWPSRHPQTFFMSNGLSGMGYGLPAAIGAKLARPDQQVMAVLGDGGFSMNSQELETMTRLGARIIVVVLADTSYSLIRHAQAGRNLPNHGVDFTPIDSVAIASACGVAGIRATTPEDVSAAVGKAVREGESLVVEAAIDPDSWRGLV